MATVKRGFVKFDRKIKDWGWYTDVKTFKLFFHLILCANFTDGFFLGVPIKRGQLAKSVDHLAVETGLTCAEVRTAIKHLESTGEITSKGHPKFTVFSIVNYDLYQSEQRANNEHLANSLTSNQRADNEQLTSNQRQYKNDKNEKNDNNDKNKALSLLSEKIIFLFSEKWGRKPNEIEANAISEMLSRTEDEEAFERALIISVEAGKKNINYLRGVYKNICMEKEEKPKEQSVDMQAANRLKALNERKMKNE